VCVCVCVREREGERASVLMWACMSVMSLMSGVALDIWK